jgi:hypothetical protein
MISVSGLVYVTGVILVAFFLPLIDRVIGNVWIVSVLLIGYLVILRVIAIGIQAAIEKRNRAKKQ